MLDDELVGALHHAAANQIALCLDVGIRNLSSLAPQISAAPSRIAAASERTKPASAAALSPVHLTLSWRLQDGSSVHTKGAIANLPSYTETVH